MKLLVRQIIFKGHVASLCYDVRFGITMIIVKAFLAEKTQRGKLCIYFVTSVCKFLYCAMSILCDPHYL